MSDMALGNLTIDLDRYEVRVDVQPVPLTFVEFELLVRLARKPGKVLTREELTRALHDYGDLRTDSQALTVYISRLRKKLSGSHPWRIETVRRRGYALSEDTTGSQNGQRN
jgi:DNA-binding response OmpR family regulator